MTKPLTRFFRRNWGVLAIVLAWQIWVLIADLNAIVMPSPGWVLWDIVTNPVLYLTSTAQTGLSAISGLSVGLIVGTLLAVAAWSSRLLAGFLTPLGLVLSSVPVVAFIPIIARLMGSGQPTVITVVAILTFFPTFIYVGAGLRSQPPGANDMVAVFGASPLARFVHLVVPSAVPNAMIALRLTIPEAMLAAILAEFLIGNRGLGYLFKDAVARFAMERAFGISLVVTLISIALFFAVQNAQHAIKARWS